MGNRVRMGWPAIALGLLALTCLGLARTPYLVVWETSLLHVLATAFGAVALTAGVGAAGGAWARPAGWRSITAAVGVLAAAVTLYVGYNSYDAYATAGHHAVLVIATIGGATTSLALGMVIGWPGIAGGHIGPGDSGAPRPAPVAAKPPPPEPMAPAQTSTCTAEAETTAATTRFPVRLQTVLAVVGLVIGLIALARELVAAILALIR